MSNFSSLSRTLYEPRQPFVIGQGVESMDYNPFYFVIKCLIFFWAGFFIGGIFEKAAHEAEKLAKNDSKISAKGLGQFVQLTLCIMFLLTCLEVSKLHLRNWTLELQNTMAGLFFVAAFFNNQPSLISRYQF